MIKILITGDSKCSSKLKIEQLFNDLESRILKTNLYIASRGEIYGIDNFVKQLCLHKQIPYGEFIPYFKPANQFCLTEFYKHGITRKKNHFHIRDALAVDWADLIFILCYSNNKKKYELLIEKIQKAKKKLKIIYLT